MTPTLETESDLAKENLTADLVERCWGVKLVKMKKFYRFDYAIVDNSGGTEVIGFIELKYRKTPRSQYKDYMISEEKVRWAMDTRSKFNTPCYIVVGWSDTVGYYSVLPGARITLVLSGRMDAHDQAEAEPCFLIPVSDFGIVKPSTQ